MKKSDRFKRTAAWLFILALACALILAASEGWRLFVLATGIISAALAYASLACSRDAEEEENRP